jgi:hypothetical protein
MAGRTPLACLAILVALCAAAILAPVASAGTTVCTESLSCPPSISLSKNGPQYVNKGDTAEYTFDVTNTGGYNVDDLVVADDRCSPMSDPAGDDGDGLLNPGETWTYTCSYAPAGDPGDEVVNHATADGVAGNEAPVHAEASHSTWITALQVTKTVDLQTADPYDELNYTITITHGGPVTFDYSGYLYDQGCEDLSSNSENADGPWFWLEPGESVTYTCHHNFEGSSSYTNEACAPPAVDRGQPQVSEFAYDLFVCGSATTTLAKHFVSGQIFEDMNADGARQEGEPPLQGIVVYADLNGNGVRDEGEPTSTSDAQGNYSVEVGLGTTTIREEVPGGFTCSFPSGCAHNVDLPKNQAPEPPLELSRGAAGRATDPTGKDFGDWRPASVTGTVVGDDNGNGARDSGEGGLAGIAVFADLDGNGTLDAGEPSTTTASDGSYKLGGLKPGGYVIRHVLIQDGRTCSAPVPGCNYNLTLRSNGSETNKDFYDVNVVQRVLAARVTSGRARLLGKTGCVTGGGFSARIRGRQIQRAVLMVDGRAVKTLVSLKNNRTYRYRVNVSKLAVGRHTLAVKVTFRSSSHTKSKTLRLNFQRCARQLRAPAFTG